MTMMPQPPQCGPSPSMPAAASPSRRGWPSPSSVVTARKRVTVPVAGQRHHAHLRYRNPSHGKAWTTELRRASSHVPHFLTLLVGHGCRAPILTLQQQVTVGDISGKIHPPPLRGLRAASFACNTCVFSLRCEVGRHFVSLRIGDSLQVGVNSAAIAVSCSLNHV